jgi:hypothetical protein
VTAERRTTKALPHRLVKPEVVVEVTYLTWTEDNLLRQVSYHGAARASVVLVGFRALRAG